SVRDAELLGAYLLPRGRRPPLAPEPKEIQEMDPIETKPPDPTPSFRRWIAPRSIFGLFLFLMGGLLMLDRFGYVDAHDWWRFWPLFPISIGIVKLLQPRRDGQRFFGGLLILIFGAILLRNLGWIPDFRIDGRLIFPAVLLWIGLAMMFSRHRSGCWGGRRGRWDRGDRALDAPEDSGSEVDSFAVLGSSRATSTSQNFRGGHATAVLGSYELDLRRAAIPPGEEAVINTVAVWG